MMDERTRLMIETYIPGPRDETLGDGEYYYLQNNRVIRVWALDILPYRHGTEYGIYQQRGGRLVRVDTGWGDPNRGVNMGELYDNKDDCRNGTHGWVEGWENLRKIQEQESRPG